MTDYPVFDGAAGGFPELGNPQTVFLPVSSNAEGKWLKGAYKSPDAITEVSETNYL